MLESTSVFQRQRTLKTLNQMSAKPYQLHIYRNGKWALMSTTAILPGDLVSLLPPKPPAAVRCPLSIPRPLAYGTAPPPRRASLLLITRSSHDRDLRS